MFGLTFLSGLRSDWWDDFTGGIDDFFSTIQNWVDELNEVTSDFFGFMRSIFSFMPEELMLFIVIAIGISIGALVLKLLRG